MKTSPKPCNSTVFNPESLTSLPIANYTSFLLWSPTLAERSRSYKILKKPRHSNWQNKLSSLLSVLPQAITSSSIDLHPDIPPTQSLGIGFAYTPNHPFVCIDLDNLSQENYTLASLLQSYTEISPSGQGYHIIISLPTIEDKLTLETLFGSGKRNKTDERDLYISTGFVTLTNNLVTEFPSDIRTLTLDELTSILSSYFKTHQPQETLQEAIQEATPQPQEATLPSSLTKEQVLSLLNKISVKNLTSDIFDRLRNNERVLLNKSCEEEAREPWITIGQAIHNNFNGSLTGYQLWRDWSAQGNKFNQGDCEAVWKSFKDSSSPITIATLVKLVKRQFAHFEHVSNKGFVLPTLQNFRAMLDYLGITPSFNVFSKQVSITVPPHKQDEWGINASVLSIAVISSLIQSELYASSIKLAPGAFNLGQIKLYTQAAASANIVNPVKDYFTKCGENWDKRDYITPLMRTIITPPGHVKYRSSYQLFLRKWLLQVAAAACHDTDNPPRLNRVLIFQGAQNVGKTRWVESLFPPELRSFCSADKDLKLGRFKTESTKLAMELTNTLICNINEIDRLFRSATYSEFKAFLDQTQDQVVLPYGDAPTLMTRRTVFIGSTNENEFLTDITGNRRIETIRVDNMDFNHNIPIDQLWGQVYNLYASGEKWWLDGDSVVLEELQAIEHRDFINSKIMAFKSDSIALELDDIFDSTVPFNVNTWRKYTLKDIKALLSLNSSPNGFKIRALKDTITVWRNQIPDAPLPVQGSGQRPRIYYWMPPLLQNVPTTAFESYEEQHEKHIQ